MPKIGQMIVKLPAKSVPAAVSHLIDVYRRDRQTGRVCKPSSVGGKMSPDELIPMIVPSFEQDPTYYYDREGEAEFVLLWARRMCAGGAWK